MGNLTDKVKKEVQNAASGFETTAKDIVQKANPLDQKINQNDTSETGIESLRLSYTTIKRAKNTIKSTSQGIKTTSRAAKAAYHTAANTVKAAKFSVKAAYRAAQAAYRAAQYAVQAAAFIAKVTVNAVVQIAAALTDPVVLAVIAAALVLFLVIYGIIIIIFGADTSTRDAYINAAGLGDVSEGYNDGLTYFQNAVEKRKGEYDAMIDALYYNGNDLTNSDLVYMERTKYGNPPNITTYETGFASDAYKGILHDAWDLQLDPLDALAIAYVYLEKQQNIDYETEADIYNVTYTEEVFDEILNICVQFIEEVHGNYTCPDENCTINEAWKSACSDLQTDVEMVRNAVSDKNDVYLDWMQSNAQALINNPNDANAYNDLIEDINHFRGIVSNELIDWLKANANRVANKGTNGIPQYICNHKHNLHSIGLSFLTAEDIMNALEFTDTDKEWVEYTKTGIQNNIAKEE